MRYQQGTCRNSLSNLSKRPFDSLEKNVNDTVIPWFDDDNYDDNDDAFF